MFISHLQFADNTICFVEANSNQVLTLNWIMKIFECISRLKVNLSKSRMVGIGVRKEELSICAGIHGCKMKSWPLKYLEMLLGGNQRFIAFWDLVVERGHKKLAGWKKSSISFFFCGRDANYIDQGSYVQCAC